MTKEPSVCRTSIHLGKVIVQTKINIQGAWAWNLRRLPASLKLCEVCRDK